MKDSFGHFGCLKLWGYAKQIHTEFERNVATGRLRLWSLGAPSPSIVAGAASPEAPAPARAKWHGRRGRHGKTWEDMGRDEFSVNKNALGRN